ncbi:aldo/keto reductase [Novosphingobium kaempferiae]|uniref:aldo/keto reductase n=1 Tax=Novosphingobium kaempferiae TaxID=2896849 RepID=UPI001E2ED0F1|nr:aldo/keto reductase [Novosphingobium kaempferiae]
MTSAIRPDEAHGFAFGPFILKPERQLLLRDGAPVPLGGRALDLLIALVERPGELVEKRYLMARAWPDTNVEDGNLKVNIASLRRALRDGSDENGFIATVTGRGYRFIAPVRRLGGFASTASAPPSPRPTHRLPEAIRMVGRTKQIATARTAIDQGRLLSIVGPGGVGKSALALALAGDLATETGIDALRVDLSGLDPADGPAAVHTAIATALDLDARTASLSSLTDDLRGHGTLLILDNCEPAVDAVAVTVDSLIAAASTLRIIATSREPLCARRERILRLRGLDLPPECPGPSADEALRFGAVELFVDRAGDLTRPFRLDDDEAPEVARLCRMLDGLPLAIEFAAMQVATFGVRQLRLLLESGMEQLGGLRSDTPRHRSLRSCIDWSYRLLSERERFLLRHLSRQTNSFTLASACRIGMDAGMLESAAIDDLSALVSKSMVEVQTSSTATRYCLPHTVRTYGLARAAETGRKGQTWPPPAGDAFLGIAADAALGAVSERLRGATPYARMLFTESNFKFVGTVHEIAEELNVPMAQVALAWMLARAETISLLPGARRPMQLEGNLPATSLSFIQGQGKRFDAVDDMHPFDP